MIDSYPIYTWNHDARMIFESSTRSACMAGDVVCEIVTQMTSSFALQTICCKQNYAQFFFHSNRSIEKSRCHPLLSGRSVANRTMLKNLLLRTQAFEIEMSVLMVVHD